MIIREKYLKKIRNFYDADLIKVVTGVRRCGKSTILKQIISEIVAKGTKEEQIIYINLEYDDYDFIKDNSDLSKYIKSLIKNENKYYLFIDEIQNVLNWEKTVNSFKAKYGDDISIFITGSNSDLLSSEISTLLSGRYVELKMSTFSFSEIVEYYKNEKIDIDLEGEFNNYILWGGFPQSFKFRDVEDKKTYLNDIYNSIVLKDIVKRFNIKDVNLLNRLLEYIVTTPSQTFSVESIVDYFKSDNRNVPKETIYNYLEYMCKALLIHKCERYDIRGKRILTGKYKYYLTDLGLGSVVSSTKKLQVGAYIENIVYNELVSRGYTVNVGTLPNGEIDFIASKMGEKVYYQVTYLLSTDEIIAREFGAFENISDSYPKYVLSTDKFDYSQNGVIHKNIIDWLLNIE